MCYFTLTQDSDFIVHFFFKTLLLYLLWFYCSVVSTSSVELYFQTFYADLVFLLVTQTEEVLNKFWMNEHDLIVFNLCQNKLNCNQTLVQSNTNQRLWLLVYFHFSILYIVLFAMLLLLFFFSVEKNFTPYIVLISWQVTHI